MAAKKTLALYRAQWPQRDLGPLELNGPRGTLALQSPMTVRRSDSEVQSFQEELGPPDLHGGQRDPGSRDLLGDHTGLSYLNGGQRYPNPNPNLTGLNGAQRDLSPSELNGGQRYTLALAPEPNGGQRDPNPTGFNGGQRDLGPSSRA